MGKTVLKGKTVLGHSNPRITQRLEQQFTSELISVQDQEESFCTHQSARELSLWSLSYRSSKINTGRQDLGLGSGFDRDPLDLDRPGRQLHQRDYARQGWAAKTSQPSWGPRDPGQNLHADTAYKRPTNNRQGGLSQDSSPHCDSHPDISQRYGRMTITVWGSPKSSVLSPSVDLRGAITQRPER